MTTSNAGYKAMILAAGLGTRLKPWTDHAPKALAVVHGKPLLQHNIIYLQQHGIYDVVVNVHHFAEQIVAAIEKNNGWGSRITISDEREAALETGGGIVKAAAYLHGGPFVVMNADVLTDMDLGAMMRFHQEHRPLATLATSSRATSRYLLFTPEGRLCGWHNVAEGETIDTLLAQKGGRIMARAFNGIHVISPTLFQLNKRVGKFSIINLYMDLMHEHALVAYDTDARFIDVGKPGSVEAAEVMFGGR